MTDSIQATVAVETVAQFSQADLAAAMQQAAMAQAAANRQVKVINETIPVPKWHKGEAIDVDAKETKKPSKAKLAAMERVSKIEREQGTIASHMTSIGMAMGSFQVESEFLQVDVLAHVENALREAMKLGLVIEHLKAKADCYTLIVNNWNDFRVGAGRAPLSTGARDNYMSKIRKFVQDRGANPLDLFGNLATKAKKQASKSTSSNATKSTTSEANQAPVKSATQEITNDLSQIELLPMLGAPCLVAYLEKWIECNKSTASLAAVAKSAMDFMGHVKGMTGIVSSK